MFVDEPSECGWCAGFDLIPVDSESARDGLFVAVVLRVELVVETFQHHDVSVLPSARLGHVDGVVFFRVDGDEVIVHVFSVDECFVVYHASDELGV